jgi:hypothetical protein
MQLNRLKLRRAVASARFMKGGAVCRPQQRGQDSSRDVSAPPPRPAARPAAVPRGSLTSRLPVVFLLSARSRSCASRAAQSSVMHSTLRARRAVCALGQARRVATV